MTAQRLTLTGWLAVMYAVLGLPFFFALAAFLRSQPLNYGQQPVGHPNRASAKRTVADEAVKGGRTMLCA